MKTTARQLANVLLVSLLSAALVSHAQVTDTQPGESVPQESSFDMTMYMEANWKINLILAIRQSKRVTITVRDAKNAVIYQEYVRGSTGNRGKYRRKFNFDGSESGVYQFEITDGQQTIVRRVEVVDMPAVEPQRYIVYGPQTSL